MRTALPRLGGANVLSQGDGFGGGRDAQLLSQARPAGGVDLQGRTGIAQGQMHAHQAAIGLLLQWVGRQPAREGDAGRLQFPAGLLP